MSRHRVSCRDITSRLLQSSTVVHDVATSFFMSRHQLLTLLLLNGLFHDVMTSAQVVGTVPLLVIMSRHQFSCRDIPCCYCRLHWLFIMSRLQLPCRDINLFNFCSLFSCKGCDSCRDLHQFPFDFSDVATSELD